MALTYAGQSEGQSAYGSMVDRWINDALLDIYGDYGIEDVATGNVLGGDPNGRFLPMPRGFLWETAVFINGNPTDFNPDLSEADYLSGGYSLPQWYAHWGKPMTKLVLGPQPPDSDYPFVIYYMRSPYELVNDNQIPELPPKWRQALAKYAAAQIVLADGLMFSQQKFQVFDRDYERAKMEFQGFYSAPSRNRYATPARDRDY